ncbi:MAG: histidine kinase [Lachnospiraceae bacterium]|nr:histidine kinase [Lachnospiraceae bacterium]
MRKLLDLFRNQKLNIKFTFIIVLFIIVPLGILASYLFYVMEKNVIDENVSYMEYTMRRNQEYTVSKIDSINMSTQFFLSDESLADILARSQRNEEITVEEWLEFKNDEVSSLERLVNNNPVLYGVRVYSENNHVQEMMPILYQNERLHKQEWAYNEDYLGWNYDYTDNLFSKYNLNQERKLIGLITFIFNDNNEKIGTIEAAMTMETMFPSIYESIEDEWGFFYSEDGEYYLDENKETPDLAILQEIIARLPAGKEIVTEYYASGNQKLVLSFMPINELDGTLVCVKNIADSVKNVQNIQTVFVLAMGALTVLLAFVINRVVQRLLKQFYEILRSIRKVQKGDLDVVIENCGKDEMGELGNQINKMLRRIKELMEDNLKREMLVKNSEIRALQNQINAHFIYNVLESIKMMAEIEEEYEISDAVTSLGKLLRYSMKWVSGNVRVSEELEYIKNYMALINLRFDYEIYLSLNIPDLILKQEIPKMSLQPIIENAIYHGIEEMAEDSNIYMKGIIEEDECLIEITDMGKGMSEEDVEKLRMKIAGELDSNGGSGNGIGLKNVQDRIHIAFGEKYGIEIASMLGCYTKIIVRIPITHRAKEE